MGDVRTAVPSNEAAANVDPMSEPDDNEIRYEWVRYFDAAKRGEIDPAGEHLDEYVAFYNGAVVGYGKDSYELQRQVANRIGVHWARVVVMFLGSSDVIVY